MITPKQEGDIIAALIIVRNALQFYADLKYDHTMGFPPEVQWAAENAIKQVDELLSWHEGYATVRKLLW